MKTARSIEEQEARKAEENAGVSGAQNSASVKAKYDHRIDAERIKPFQFKPGVSGNPGGRPKVDLASEIAKAIFENDGPAIYAAFSKMLRKGSPYAFQVLSDRAYGKLKERHELDISPYKDVPTQDLEQQIRRLEIQLGYRTAEESEAHPLTSDGPNSKPN